MPDLAAKRKEGNAEKRKNGKVEKHKRRKVQAKCSGCCSLMEEEKSDASNNATSWGVLFRLAQGQNQGQNQSQALKVRFGSVL
jgi:hypothetical protein